MLDSHVHLSTPLYICPQVVERSDSGHQVSFEGEVTKEKLTEELVGTTWRQEEAEELFSLLQVFCISSLEWGAGGRTVRHLESGI